MTTAVLYLLTSRQPALAGTDAVFQEVSRLCGHFHGETVNLHPGRHLPRYPRALFGFEKLLRLRAAERRTSVTHVYSADPYFFPVLARLRNPIVYTLAAGLSAAADRTHIELLKTRTHVVVSNTRDADLLRSWGLDQAEIIAPGLDTSHIRRGGLALGSGFTLLLASAPWVGEQFDTKGIDVLLDAAMRLSDLKLILVWRGRHHAALLRRVNARDLAARVEIVNRGVVIDDYLARSHAAVVLAKRPDLVKAFPHSLLESLAAGKPVLLSAAIPMADFVRERQCGVVVDDVACEPVVEAIRRLRAGYRDFSGNAMALAPETFSLDAMVASHGALYARVRQAAGVA